MAVTDAAGAPYQAPRILEVPRAHWACARARLVRAVPCRHARRRRLRVAPPDRGSAGAAER